MTLAFTASALGTISDGSGVRASINNEEAVRSLRTTSTAAIHQYITATVAGINTVWHTIAICTHITAAFHVRVH